VKITGEFVVHAPRPLVFDRLNDARFFASCLEGVRDLTEVDATHYTAVLETKVAYIKFKFDIDVKFLDVVSPSKVVIKAEGAPIGVVGRFSSVATALLEEADEGRNTKIAYEVDVSLTGKLGAMGAPVLKSKAKEMEKGFVNSANAAFAASPATAQQ
jgi:uncharacterized protein